MHRISELSIRTQLLLVLGFGIGIALFIAGGVVATTEHRDGYAELRRRLQTQAEIVAANIQSAVAFDDSDGATRILQGLAADTDIAHAEVLRANGSRLAYQAYGSPRKAADDDIEASAAVILDPLRIGTVRLHASTANVDGAIAGRLETLGVVLLIAMVLTLISCFWLQRLVSHPITEIAAAVDGVSNAADFNIRVPVRGSSEVRRLASAFNSMLSELAQSDVRLKGHQKELEHQVRARTLELATALEVAQQAAKAKADFLANMSHEIRTPMNGVIGMLDLLHDEILGAEAKDMLDTARGSADSLLSLINNILDFSKIDAGKLHLESIDVELLPLVEEVTTLFSRQAFNKGVEISCAVHNDVPEVVGGDPTRLRQILTNLVGNAVKFTDQGEVFVGIQMRPERQVAASVEDDTAAKAIVQIVVKDTGIGMRSEVIPGLFSAFEQADTSTTRRYGGTGLGLAITKKLVDAMGGTIKVTSTPAEGTTFSVFLPMVQRPAATASRSELLDGLNILIVDDNATNRCIVQHYLSNAGLRHESAASADEALQVIRAKICSSHAFDVILLDYQMPGTDGMGFLRALHADPAIASIPCIVLSSLGERVEEADSRQVAAWLTKPVRKMQLLQVIAGVMGRIPRAQAALIREATPSRYTRSRVLLVEDNPVNQLVAARLLKTLGIEPQIAENGAKAVAMIQQQRFDLVLMDCQMPEMDGYEATQAVRMWEQSAAVAPERRLPVIAITANALVGDRERCAAAGMDGYLSKPITRDGLSTLLRQWLTPDSQVLVGGQAAAGG